jgi:3-(3-hydroxy-phenyl)propionate hydroxylase
MQDRVLAPFAQDIADWLGAHHAQAVLVRPDRVVFATGAPGMLARQWGGMLAGAARQEPAIA